MTTDLKLYFDICYTFERALTDAQTAAIRRHAVSACEKAGWHRATAIENLQAITGLPHRLAESFVEAEFSKLSRPVD